MNKRNRKTKQRLKVFVYDDYEQAFENAIKKGLKNIDKWMYMYSAGFRDYFKHSLTREYTSYINLRIKRTSKYRIPP